MPGDRRAPIVPDDHRLVGAKRRSEGDHVANEVKDRVALDLVRLRGLTVAAHVRGDRVVAGLRERLQLMAPRIPGLGPTVAQKHERPFAGLGEMDFEAVRLDRSMRDLNHGLSP